ncbi:MAG: ComF family protein [Bacteroidales bacterium]|nr:ComF family protein [Bacteroidales bacterium]
MKTLIKPATWLDDLLSLFYPRICLACGNSLYPNEEVVCFSCLYHLPETDFHVEKDNPVSRLFWGKVPVENASACYYFSKGGKVQHLIHQLKYQGRRSIGEYLGTYYGHKLRASGFYSDIDVIIPVPLHPKKLKKRGYNQSVIIADGLAEGMYVPVKTRTLIRKIASSTQTKKSKYERWENVKDIFGVNNAETLEGKHILLVDDVITTGSTLEACILRLNDITGIRVSVAALACAVH